MLRFTLSLLTLSLVLTACGNDEDLSDTSGCESSTGDTDAMSESTSTGEEPTTDGAKSLTLMVRLNIREAQFQVFVGDKLFVEMEAEFCPHDGTHYECEFALLGGGYKLDFEPVAGYDMPAIQIVQVDGYGDIVTADYVKQ